MTGVLTDVSTSTMLVGVGIFGIFAGVTTLSPVLSRPFVRVFGAPFSRLFGVVGRLSRANAVRNPRRTAATASALMIGLMLVAMMSVLSASTNSSIDRLVDRSLGADFVVSDAIGTPFSTEVAQRAARVPGVGSVTPQRFAPMQLDGKVVHASAFAPQALDKAVKVDYLTGSSAGLERRGLLVDEKVAAEQGLRIRSTAPVTFHDGTKLTLRVGGTYVSSPLLGPYVVSLDTLEAGGVKPADNWLYIDSETGADTAQVQRALQAELTAFPNVSLRDHSEFKQEQRAQVNQLLYLIYALLALAVVIAVLGIVNTLALSVIERTREIGLLRAVGLARRQLRRMIRLESVVISVFGAVLGLGLGVGFGVALQRVLSDDGIDVLTVPTGTLVGFLAVAGVVGVLAAVWPARRAARLDVLRAITTE